LLLGFLPCGLLYGALLTAVSTGTPAAGAASMLAFGAGTALALVGIGVFSNYIGARLGRWSNELAGASLLLMGAFLLWRGLLQVAAAHSCHGS
jgi:sulfite exporter TauE/SafE